MTQNWRSLYYIINNQGQLLCVEWSERTCKDMYFTSLSVLNVHWNPINGNASGNANGKFGLTEKRTTYCSLLLFLLVCRCFIYLRLLRNSNLLFTTVPVSKLLYPEYWCGQTDRRRNEWTNNARTIPSSRLQWLRIITHIVVNINFFIYSTRNCIVFRFAAV